MKLSRTLPILFIANIVAITLFLSQYPNRVPIHVNASGVIDGWGSKWIILILAFVPLIIWIFAQRNKKKTNPTHNPTTIILNILMIYFLLLSWLPVYLGSLYKYPTNEPLTYHFLLFIMIPMSLLFILLGNYMSKLRPNKWIGIRTKWTMKNDEVWFRTHRFAAYSYVIAGFILLITTWIGFLTKSYTTTTFIGFLCLIILTSVAPILYSFFLHFKIQRGR